MRGSRLLVAALLATTSLAGCISSSWDPLDDQDAAASALDPDDVTPLGNGSVEETEEGLRIVLEDVQLPLDEQLSIPEGTELVRITAESSSGVPVLPVARHADTDAYRCLPALRTAWNVGYDDRTRCSGLTALDPLSTNWTISVSGGSFSYQTPFQLSGTYEPATAELVEVELIEDARGGVLERVDTGKLSMPHHDLGETTNHTVASHDGTDLFVQVTTPAGGHNATYPTLLVSSPYTYGDRASGERAYDPLIREYVARGYAVVVADVRGFARSDGCVEVWGPNETADQAALVDWVTKQDFSDGHVGMYGVSYVGTTPVEAAVQAPKGLDAIVSTAGVINAYRDWHFGGVPNGESIGSPTFYQELGTSTTTPDPVERAMDTANGVCDPTLVARANDPRAIYDDYYRPRNFTERADQVEAAVMVEHAYEDPNVKSSMQLDWFNALDVPKLGLFGHWSHQPAARADEATLRLAWMDQFVKGQPTGLGNVSLASVSANGDRYREAPAWPSNTTPTRLFPDPGKAALSPDPSEGQATFVAEPTGTVAAQEAALPTLLSFTRTLEANVSLAGLGSLALDVTLQGASNAFLAAELYELTGEDTRKLVTYGWSNLAHRNGHASYEPVPPGERVEARLPLLPSEYTFGEGETIELVVRGVSEADWSRYKPGRAAHVTVHAGENGTVLRLPTVGGEAWRATPNSVDTVPAG